MSWLSPLVSMRRTARSSKAAARAFEPFVRASVRRSGPIPPGFWRRKYSVGFIVTLITLHNRASLATEGDVGSIQLEAYTRLSGQPSEGIGELIYLASLEHDHAFLEGCENAVAFFAALVASRATPGVAPVEEADKLRLRALMSDQGLVMWAGPHCADLWRQYFDDRIAA